MKRALNAIGWIGFLLVVVAVVIRFSRPELQVWSQRLALAGLAATALYTLSQWREIGRSFQGRNTKYGSIAATSVVLVLGILVALNWIANRHNARWDLTAARQFSLSDQTKQVVGQLTKPLVVKVFHIRTAEEYRDQLEEYTHLSSQISAEYVDVLRDPAAAERYSIANYPTVVLEYDGRTERASSIDEQSLTNALKRVIEGRPKKIYFLQGHGEHDPQAPERNGYSSIADALATDNFEVARLSLAQEGAVPADATVLVIAGPTRDLLGAEVDLLRAYLQRGGKLALLLNPPDSGTAPDVTNLVGLAQEWGIVIGNDLIVDVSAVGQQLGTGPTVPLATPLRHTITEGFNVYTAFPLARSVTPIEGGTGGRIAMKFLETSERSWAEADVKGLFVQGAQVSRDLAAGDKAGPVSLAAAVSAAATEAPASETPDAPKPEARLVVIGDSDFASNAAVSFSGNRDLFLNVANWLAQQEALIAIRPRNPEDRPISMTADQGRMVFWFTMVLIPLLLFGNAVRLWWRRR